jgi:hypothetical protein
VEQRDLQFASIGTKNGCPSYAKHRVGKPWPQPATNESVWSLLSRNLIFERRSAHEKLALRPPKNVYVARSLA